MYKCKYIFGETIKYNGEIHKVIGIRFTSKGVLYKLDRVYNWVKEEDIL